MASTKEIFASGLNYILRDIKDTHEEIVSGREYLTKYIQKNGLVKRLKDYHKEFEMYCKEFSYTKEDMKKYNIHPATDEEINADYEKDMTECGYDSRYTEEMHKALIDKVNELNKAEDLPLLAY